MSRFQCIVFSVVIFEVFFLWGTESNPTKSHVNLSAEKIASIKEIGETVKRFINSDILPCDDYYSYTCTIYNTSAPRKIFYEEPSIAEKFENIIKSQKMNNVDVKLLDYFTSCKERDEQDVGTFMKNFNFLNTRWPVFDANWNEDKFDLVSAITEMKSYSIPVIIDPKFVEERASSKRYFSLKIINEPFLKDDGNKAMITEKLINLGIKEAEDVVNQCVDFENKFTEIISTSEIDSKNAFESDYKGLKEKFPNIHWDKQIASIMGRTPSDTFPVRIDDIETVKKVYASIAEMSPKFVANYFFCRFVSKVFNKKTVGETNDEFCRNQTYHYFYRVFPQQLLSNLPTGNYKEQFLGMMYSVIKVLKEHLNISEVGGDTKEKTDEFILNNYLSDLTEEGIKKEFENVEIEYNNYLQNEFNLIRHTLKMDAYYFFDENLAKWKLIYRTLSFRFYTYLYLTQKHPSAIIYNVLQDVIVIAPIYVLIIKLLINEFSASTRDCYRRKLNSEKINDRYVVIAFITKLYFEAYIDWADKNEEIVQAENAVLKEYGLTSKQLLFVNFMQYFCREPALQSLVSFVLRNLKEFSDVYNCPIVSRMNLEEKCEIT